MGENLKRCLEEAWVRVISRDETGVCLETSQGVKMGTLARR